MLVNRNQPIVAGLLGASIVGIVAATALPFNDRIRPLAKVPNKGNSEVIERKN